MSYARGRSSTLSYIVPVGGLTLLIGSILWGIGDSTIVADFTATWDGGSAATQAGRGYLQTAYQYMPFLIVARVGLEAIVVARGTHAAPGAMIGATVALWAILIGLLTYGTVVPNVVDGLVQAATARQTALESVGFYGVIQTFQRGFLEWFPGLMAGAVAAGYLIGPIRRDLLGGGL
jgi:hypothetical protein